MSEKKKEVTVVYLNSKEGEAVLPSVMQQHSFKSLHIANLPAPGKDSGYINIVPLNGSKEKIVRTYYLTQSGEGHFYLNEVRYKIRNIVNALPRLVTATMPPTGAQRQEEQQAQAPQQAQPTEEDKAAAKAAAQQRLEEKRAQQAAAAEAKAAEAQQEEKAPEAPEEKKPEAPKAPQAKKEASPVHPNYNKIVNCIKKNIPVYLVGEAGTGKNFTLEAIAKELNLPFFFANSIQSEYKITGFIDVGGRYIETEFYRAFKDGGMFFLDELDASIPEVLVLLNAAIANRYFNFPNGTIHAHPDFRVVAAGNTYGNGADEQYTGRLVLDSATLDRFVVIDFDYNREIALSIAKKEGAANPTELVNFIFGLRAFAKENGIRATFSYRAIISAARLEDVLTLKEIVEIAVVKGLDKDTVKTLKCGNGCGKYFYALEEVKKGEKQLA